MHCYKLLFILLIALWGFFSKTVCAQQTDKPKTTRVLFIFDESRSMLGEWESGRKIDVARVMLAKMIDSLSVLPNVQMALRMYGHQSPVPPQDCGDTRLEVPFSEDNVDEIKYKLETIEPNGTTPIAYSLEQSANDFPPCDNCRNMIILITDGIEACAGNPCEIANRLHQKGISLKPYVIGIGLDVDLVEAFSCMGYYFDAGKEDDFDNIMVEIIARTAMRTSLQINLLDSDGRPDETGVNMTFYNKKTGEITNNYIHTINQFERPDTVEVDPLIDYAVDIHTIPKVRIENMRLRPGFHNVVEQAAPQGYLKITEINDNKYNESWFLIKDSKTGKTIHQQQFEKSERYLVGNYDIEVLIWPRQYHHNVLVEQDKTTDIKITQPGLATFVIPSQGYSSLYFMEDKVPNWLMNLDGVRKKSIYLQPGKYLAVFRPEKMRRTFYSQEQYFEIKSGYGTNVIFK